MIVITRDNDSIDAVLWRVFGNTDALVQVLEANPHAKDTAILPAGVHLVLPDLPIPKPPKQTIKLWD